MVALLTELLGLPGIDVESYAVVEDGLIVDVEAHRASVECPRCGTLSQHLHQNHWHLVRDLPLSHYRKTWLRVNRRQFKCAVCGKPFSELEDAIAAVNRAFKQPSRSDRREIQRLQEANQRGPGEFWPQAEFY